MPEQTGNLEQQVEQILRESFAQPEGEQETNTLNEQRETTEGKHVIDVDLYRLEGGAVLLVPNNGTNPLDTHAVESVAPPTDPEIAPPTMPLTNEAKEQEEIPQDTPPEPAPARARRRMKPSLLLVPLVLLCLLAAGTGTYLFVFPLTATATVTITPQAHTLQKDATFPIAAKPKAGQVQGRPLEAISFTTSKTAPATGHAHDDATRATGVITFYNADSQSYTIPAGTSFTVQGVTVVTDHTVSVQAAVPPSFGTGITSAHVLQAGAGGNIAAHAIDTRCCGSAFLTATNTTPFSGDRTPEATALSSQVICKMLQATS